MSCLGVLFAVTREQVTALKELPRQARPDYVSDDLERVFFAEERDYMEELDKSWDAMHRVLTGGQLLFGNEQAPLSGVILGGEVLYGDADGEDDYIITCKPPEQVAQIADAMELVTEEEFRQRYFALDEEVYGFPLSEDDLEYTWSYFVESIPFWKRAKGRFVLFTVDQ